ncbi:Dihydrofolate reductase [Dyadobacter sp. CECT 9275]|uniref:Dihydrofolate reductase n=2 Tax=Dyadobacter helix TaxID=2822344 RepID=A0A916NA72_9BACT|nr:Dihydrofolate reductase [Dyadobacter sp. CECT 9275]
MSENRVIGINNSLPWHLPDEWEHFRKVTNGKPFIMGRKSYEAPDALHSPYRNIVLSSEKKETAGVEYAASLDEALALLEEEPEAFILGGATVFKEAIHLAERLYLTVVHAHLEGDAFFPQVNSDEWELTSSEYHGTDERHVYSFSMNIYDRKIPGRQS